MSQVSLSLMTFIVYEFIKRKHLFYNLCNLGEVPRVMQSKIPALIISFEAEVSDGKVTGLLFIKLYLKLMLWKSCHF